MARVTVTGREAVRARFRALLEQSKSAMNDAVLEEAEKLASSLRLAVPVKEGNLKASIRVEPNPYRFASYMVKIGGVPGTRKKIRRGVRDADFARARVAGDNSGEFDYTLSVEFGHIGEDGEKVPAQPFAYGTWRAQKGKILGRLRRRFKKVFAPGDTRASKGG